MMHTVAIDQPVPDFESQATGGKPLRLSELRGRNVVLYFYPKDNTPGCTREGQDFRDRHAEFETLDAVVLGVSRDSLQAHEKFRTQHCFPFDLISDPDQTLSRLFDVIRPKKMYGRETLGLERSTFLIDSAGVLRREWRKVKVDGHVEKVLNALRTLHQEQG